MNEKYLLIGQWTYEDVVYVWINDIAPEIEEPALEQQEWLLWGESA